MLDSEDLAHRLRAALGPYRTLREVRMFGGLCFMVNEKLALGVMSGSDLLVRVDPARSDELLAIRGAEQAEMGTGRSMGPSWVAVRAQGIASDEELDFWVDVALQYNATPTDPDRPPPH